MTQVELLEFMDDTYNACLATARKKNTDYAGSSGDDPFANFETSLLVGVPVERGMLVRLMDKIKRVSNLLDQDALVLDESIIDTLDDAINYTCLLKAYIASKAESNIDADTLDVPTMAELILDIEDGLDYDASEIEQEVVIASGTN